MLQKITEGITGEEAANIIYDNDSALAQALESPEDITAWSATRGFYNLAVPAFANAFIASNSYDNQVLSVSVGDAFSVTAGIGPSTASLAMITLYNGGNLVGYEFRGLGAGTPPQILTDEVYRVPEGVDTMVVTSSTAYDRAVKRLNIENVAANLATAVGRIDTLETEVSELKEGEVLPPRVNAGENTIAPELFGARAESTNLIGISLSPDTTSIFKDVLPFKRTLSKTSQAASMFTKDLLQIGTQGNRPSEITVAYWLKVTDIQAIWGSSMQVYFSLNSFSYNVINLLNNPGTSQSVVKVGDWTEYTEAELQVSIPLIKDGYALLVQKLTNVVWKSSYAGTTMDYYFIFNGVNSFVNYPLDIYNLTYLVDQSYDPGVDIYADPSGAFGQYPVNFGTLQSQIVEINEKIDNFNPTSGNSRYLYTGGVLYFATPFSDTQDLVRVFDVMRAGGSTGNSDINIVNQRLIPKGSPALSSGTVIKNSGDDICPANLNGSYIGGNHGWRFARLLTLTNHGKTFADVGSVYQDTAGNEFVILRRIDANQIVVVSKNTATNGWSYSFPTPSGALTYVSDGTNTGTLSGYTSASMGNLYSTLKQNLREIRVDGSLEVITDEVVICNYIDVVDDYDMLDLPDVLDRLTAARPSGGYTDNPNLSDIPADPLFNHNITYRLTEEGTTLVIHNFRTFKKLDFNFHGFIQSGALGGSSAKLYIPKVLPISDGANTWELSNIVPWNSAPATALNLVPASWEEPTSPPDRWLNFNDAVALHLGYLGDRGVGKLRKEDPTNWLSNAGFANTSLKLYPFAVSKGGAPIEADTFLTAVAFRQWLNKNDNPAGRTNFSHFDINGEGFIFLDYHGATEDAVDIPKQYQGRKIEVLEKSTNVLILGDIATNKLAVKVSNAKPYGYAVLKLK